MHSHRNHLNMLPGNDLGSMTNFLVNAKNCLKTQFIRTLLDSRWNLGVSACARCRTRAFVHRTRSRKSPHQAAGLRDRPPAILQYEMKKCMQRTPAVVRVMMTFFLDEYYTKQNCNVQATGMLMSSGTERAPKRWSAELSSDLGRVGAQLRLRCRHYRRHFSWN